VQPKNQRYLRNQRQKKHLKNAKNRRISAQNTFIFAEKCKKIAKNTRFFLAPLA